MKLTSIRKVLLSPTPSPFKVSQSLWQSRGMSPGSAYDCILTLHFITILVISGVNFSLHTLDPSIVWVFPVPLWPYASKQALYPSRMEASKGGPISWYISSWDAPTPESWSKWNPWSNWNWRSLGRESALGLSGTWFSFR